MKALRCNHIELDTLKDFFFGAQTSFLTEETEGTDANRLDQLASHMSGGGEGRGGEGRGDGSNTPCSLMLRKPDYALATGPHGLPNRR